MLGWFCGYLFLATMGICLGAKMLTGLYNDFIDVLLNGFPDKF